MITSAEYAQDLARRRGSAIEFTAQDQRGNRFIPTENNNFRCNKSRQMPNGWKNCVQFESASGYCTPTTRLMTDTTLKGFTSEENIFGEQFPDTQEYMLKSGDKLSIAAAAAITARLSELTSADLRSSPRVLSRNHSRSPMQSKSQSRKNSMLATTHSPHWNGSTKYYGGEAEEYKIQKIYSNASNFSNTSSSYVSQTDSLSPRYVPPNTLNLKNEEFDKSSSVGSYMTASHAHVAFFGFIYSGISHSSEDFTTLNRFKCEDPALDKALNESNMIRAQNGLIRGLLLRCMDNKPLYSFLHFAHFEKQLIGLPSTTKQNSTLNVLIEDLYSKNAKGEFGVFEELYTIQKTIATLNEQGLSTTRHAGYIVTCFKILDESCKQQSLEKFWLSWTGAQEIYKYSPRTWNLRKISLHRHISVNSSIRTFEYVLLCEFGNILHPSNTLQALDMCERLRVRNCGHIALYQVQLSYSSSQNSSETSDYPTNSVEKTIYGHSKDSPSSIKNTMTSPSHSSPKQIPRQHIAQTSQQQPHHNSPWSSPKTLRSSNELIAQCPLSPLSSVRGRKLIQRGYSQDIDSAHETLRRRAALLRIRDSSLGYDVDKERLSLHAISSNNATSVGSVVAAITPPRILTPTALSPHLTINQNQQQSRSLY